MLKLDNGKARMFLEDGGTVFSWILLTLWCTTHRFWGVLRHGVARTHGRYFMKKLDPSQLEPLLASLPDWRFDAQRSGISREYTFSDFLQAFGFMTKIAIASETKNHHPEWANVYNRVSITWTTHDAGGLTMNDIDMARECDQCFAKLLTRVASPAQ